MSNPPGGIEVACPACNEAAIAIVPRGSTIVEREEADGKVWVNCRSCENRFLVHYRIDR